VAVEHSFIKNQDKIENKEDFGRFKLAHLFIVSYIRKQPKWGPLGYITYKRTYARLIATLYERHQELAEQFKLGDYEEFWLTVVRVVEGIYTIQKKHCLQHRLPWSDKKAQKSAQEMFRLIWEFKFTPPGRGFFMVGTPIMDKLGGMGVNNCAFVSTMLLPEAFSEPFCFLMDSSMLGVGVGGDTEGAGSVIVVNPATSGIYVVEDSREGWVDLLRVILESFVGNGNLPERIDYSEIREEGALIKGFGGVSSGYKPLKQMVDSIVALLTKRIGKSVTSEDIADLFNLIGKCVVSGNVRRSAEILFGKPEDKSFLNLKNPSINLEALQSHRWASNNSVFVEMGQDYSELASMTATNGEPGYMWLKNSQENSRMNGKPDFKDILARGGNPCSEQTLESYEVCNLVETYPANHDSYPEFQRTLKFAYLYSKTLTLVPTHNEKTNSVMLRNRRIGTSLTGISQAITKHGRRTFFNWCDSGYSYLKKLDSKYSNWLCIPMSIKMTSIKPSGTVSLLTGSTPGIHFPHSEYYYRVIRFATNSTLVKNLKDSEYLCVEINPEKEPNTTAVYFAVKEEYFDRSKNDVSMWEQLELAAQLQTYWSDNAVSVTITFKPEEAKDIKYALELYETRLKSVSFLPLSEHGYEHAPYQTIDKATYDDYISKLKPLDLGVSEHEVTDSFCDGDKCII
jgi:ribonucleotide reductase alpha subunit